MPWPWSKRKPKEEARKEPDEEAGSISGPSVASFSSDAPSAIAGAMSEEESEMEEEPSSDAPSASRESPS